MTARRSWLLACIAATLVVVAAPRPAAVIPSGSSQGTAVGVAETDQQRTGEPLPTGRVAVNEPPSMAAPHPTSMTVPVAYGRNPDLTPEPQRVTGIASWYRYVPGGAAAGPALRRWLGPSWRGMTVLVCRDQPYVCVSVVLSDFCRCNTAGIKLIDLDLASFAALRAPTFGTVDVVVERVP